MRGSYRGPLHGIPYGLKDNFMVRGVRATANSHLMRDHVADHDATAHRRLQDAGAILLGKLGTYEYGTGDGDDLFELPFAPTRNPWDPRCFPGGSTIGGGASVAAGTAMLALGTRYDRLRSASGGRLRRGGAQADLRPRQPRGRVAELLFARLCRPDRLDGARRRPGAARHRGSSTRPIRRAPMPTSRP